MTEEMRLKMQIADLILEVANEFNEVPYSDLQGMADVQAGKIIKTLKESK